jgi:hypothetical protein
MACRITPTPSRRVVGSLAPLPASFESDEIYREPLSLVAR